MFYVLRIILPVLFLLGCNEDVAYVVQKGPAIEANTKLVNFGAVDIGTQVFVEIDVSNIGESPLDVSNLMVVASDPVFGAMGSTNFKLNANRSQSIQLFFLATRSSGVQRSN